jgi:predicted nucleic acid-binding protein
MIAIDNTLLSLLLHPKARPPQNPKTGQPIDRLDDRLEQLLHDWEEDNETIIIPTPVLTEFLILADKDGPAYLTDIDTNPHFVVAAFDQKAAIELAAMTLSARKAQPQKKRGDSQTPWSKIVFDRQIVAIAKSNGATAIYSDDIGLEKFAKQEMISVIKTWELPLPPAKQITLPGVESKQPKDRKLALDEDI